MIIPSEGLSEVNISLRRAGSLPRICDSVANSTWSEDVLFDLLFQGNSRARRSPAKTTRTRAMLPPLST